MRYLSGVMLFPSFSSYYDDHQCNVEDDDLFFLAYRTILSNDEKRKKKTHFALPSIYRTCLHEYASNCNTFFISRARLLIHREIS